LKDGNTIHPAIPGVVTMAVVNQALAASQVRYMPCRVEKQITVTAARAYVQSAATASATNRLSIYEADSSWQPTDLVSDLGTIAVDSTGIKSITSLSVTLAPGNYLLRVHSDASATPPTYTCLRGGFMGLGLSSGVQQNVFSLLRNNLTYAAAEDPGSAWTSITTSTSGFAFYFVLEWSQ